uniref:DNA methyltransferase 1-associated protein 1 n=2 Tax=Schistocephalus solidus TaxID=70667 RepID=A0A0X3NJH7_SCHSO
MTSDVLDILELEEPGVRKSLLDTRALLNRTDKKKPTLKNPPLKRPDHIPREVWGLQNTFKNELPPLVPADEAPVYKQPKVIIGTSRVRRWQWVAFTNSARSDGLVLHHWRRAGDVESEEDYYFARFNKHIEVPTYTRPEYLAHLQDSKWTMEQTDHLMDLARRFDARFVLMQDRWDVSLFPPRPSIEDMKARYYAVLASLDALRGTFLAQGLRYDVEHERRRKQQLSLLYGRTRDEVEEEERLIGELNRIETRRRDRERKKQDLQKLISQAESVARDGYERLELFTPADERIGLSAGLTADKTHSTVNPGALTFPSTTVGSASSTTASARKRSTIGSHASLQNMTSLTAASSSAELPVFSSAGAAIGATSLASSGRCSHQAGSISAGLSAVATAVSSTLAASTSIAFPDFSKNPGVHLRSQKMKLPSSLGQRKIRIIENFLSHYQMDPSPPATTQIVEAYNKLRSNILLLYELRAAMLQCDYELQAARSRMELFAPDKPLPAGLVNVTKAAVEMTARQPSGNAAADTNLSTSASSSAHQPGGPTHAVPVGVDASVIAALKAADSKRPMPPRHSLGIAGSLAAASGSLAVAAAAAANQKELPARTTEQATSEATPTGARAASSMAAPFPTSHPGMVAAGQQQGPAGQTLGNLGSPPRGLETLSDSGESFGMSPPYASVLGGEGQVRISRRKRAVATEQMRAFKRLKTKESLLD